MSFCGGGGVRGRGGGDGEEGVGWAEEGGRGRGIIYRIDDHLGIIIQFELSSLVCVFL